MTSIFLTAGIGDFFALEAFFPDRLRQSLNKVYYATKKYEEIKQFFIPEEYPNLKEHIPVWTNFNEFWSFESKAQFIYWATKNNHSDLVTPGVLDTMDFSIHEAFPRFHHTWKYNGSKILEHADINLTKDLPKNYVFVCPYSYDKRLKNRDFNESDWDALIKYLSNGKIGVVINRGQDQVPEHQSLINLSNKTTLNEAIGILKKANEYVGIDSCFSPLATKLLQPNKITIKSVNEHHCYRYLAQYFAPLKHFDFVGRTVVEVLFRKRNIAMF